MVSVLQWNINGYFNNYHELSLLVDSISPSVILLQETHVPFDIDPVTPRQYAGYFYNIPHINRNSQGVAILVKRCLPHSLLNIISTIPTVAVQLNGTQRISYVCSYISPSTSFVASDLHHILNQSPSPVVFGGDFNAWSPVWGSPVVNGRGKEIENFLLSSGIVCLNNGAATHFSTHKSFTHVDLTFCSANLFPRISWRTLRDLHGSDHYPITAKIDCHLPSLNFKFTSRFKTDNVDWEYFRGICDAFSRKYGVSHNANQEAANVLKIVRSASNACIPRSGPNFRKKRVAWWNSELSQLRKQKQLEWHKFKKSMSDENLVRYKKANALFRRAAKMAKRDSLQKLTEGINPLTSPKAIWSDIKMLAGVPKQSSFRLVNTSDGAVTNALDIANCFAKFFSHTSSDNVFSIEFLNAKTNFLNLFCPPLADSSVDSPFSFLELDFALKTAKGTTPGFDKISYPILKNLPLLVKSRLLNLYNSILVSGVWPQSWKVATTVPIQKPNTPANEIKSYRPISLLSCFSKILEKIIARRLLFHAESYGHLSPNQVAFKKHSGTIDSLVYLDHHIKSSFALKGHISLVAVDFQKAFDHIGIHVVLRQLIRWNIGPKMFNIIKSFLSNRKCRVRVNGFLSNLYPLENGTPQGSPLSVVLFLIAFNEISDILNKHDKVFHTLYADDLILFTNDKAAPDIERTLTNALKDIGTWAETAGPSISLSKTKYIHFCKKHICQAKDINIRINETEISNVNSLKLLGIIFDCKYLFNVHTKHVRESLIKRVNIIKYFSSNHCLTHPSTLISITRALILSKIDYGLPVYGQCAKTHLKLLNAPYHQAIRRSLYAFPTSPIKNIIRESGMPSLEERVSVCTLHLVSKLIHQSKSLMAITAKEVKNGHRENQSNSALMRCLTFAEKHSIWLFNIYGPERYLAPWTELESSFISSLTGYRKSCTSSSTYQQLFLAASSSLKTKEFVFIFTDGSKSEVYTSFAAVKEDGTIIRCGLLEDYCSVYTAELVGIYEAIRSSYCVNKKVVICTDSLACFDSIRSPKCNSQLVGAIRNYLGIAESNTKIMWIPGHVGIAGNEYADLAAKGVNLKPTPMSTIIEQTDLKRLIRNVCETGRSAKWACYAHHYVNINPAGQKLVIPNSVKCAQLKPFIRLRLGHTILTHSHLLCGATANQCLNCMCTLTLEHILQDCPTLMAIKRRLFGNVSLLELLKLPTPDNIQKIHNFLSSSKLIPHI